MAKTFWHISPDGQPRRCSNPSRCRFGGRGEHFSSLTEATSAAENIIAAEFSQEDLNSSFVNQTVTALHESQYGGEPAADYDTGNPKSWSNKYARDLQQAGFSGEQLQQLQNNLAGYESTISTMTDDQKVKKQVEEYIATSLVNRTPPNDDEIRKILTQEKLGRNPVVVENSEVLERYQESRRLPHDDPGRQGASQDRLDMIQEAADWAKSNPVEVPEWVGSPSPLVKSIGDPEPGSREWLLLRKGDPSNAAVGGSDIASILLVGRDCTPSRRDLLAEYKADPTGEPSVPSNPFIEYGTHMESRVLKAGAEANHLNVAVTKDTFVSIENPGNHCNFDGILLNNEGKPCGIVEVKTGWNEAMWTDSKTGRRKIPDNYRAQLLWYLHNTGLKDGVVLASVNGKPPFMLRVRRGDKINDKIGTIEDNLGKIEEFREKVAEKAGVEYRPGS